MKVIIGAAAALAIAGMAAPFNCAWATQRNDAPWTVEDNLKIEELSSFAAQDGTYSPFVYSPQRDLVAFVTRKADLETDHTVARLRVYSTQAVKDFAKRNVSLKPVFETHVSTLDNEPGLSDLHWTPDGSALLYLSRATAKATLMMWRRGSGAAATLVEPKLGIMGFDMMGSDRVVIFEPYAEPQSLVDPTNPRAPYVATGATLQAALIGRHQATPLASQRMRIVNWKEGGAERDYGVVALGKPFGTTSLSPDGSKLVFLEPMMAEWMGTCWRPRYSHQRIELISRVDDAQLAILDLETGLVTRPFDAPVGSFMILSGSEADMALWSPDGKSLLVPNTLTREDRCTTEGTRRAGAPGAYVVSADGKVVEQLSRRERNAYGEFPRMSMSARWVPQRDRVEVTWAVSPMPIFRDPGPLDFSETATYERGAQGWRKASVSSPPPKQARTKAAREAGVLELREDYNTPPAIYAVNGKGAARMLHDLAPHARDRKFGEIEIIEWQDSIGRNWKALLAFPPDYRQGERRPLMLQTHDFFSGKFFAEGPATAPYPGRAALDRGFVVMTVNDSAAYLGPRPAETARMLDGIRKGIALLDARGVIDPNKMGVLGWSRTSYFVKALVTKAPELFKAAVAADGVDYNYLQYLAWLDTTAGADLEQFTATYGGPPWQNWSEWIAEAPAFNLDKVRTPFRGESYENGGTLWEWEFYAGLRILGVPSDLIVYPQGEHVLVRPSERRASTEGSLDWIDYWVNGRKDTHPSKAEQYRRWDEQRERWEFTELAKKQAGER